MNAARRLGLVLAVTVAVGGGVAAPARATHDGLAIEAFTTYRIEDDRVAVAIDLEVVNQVPDEAEVRYFFEALALPIPVEAGNVSARSSDGASLGVRLESRPDDSAVRGVTVSLASRLFFGERQALTVTFELRGAPPRGDGSFRVNAAYAWFSAWAYGDPGFATVVVEIPPGYEAEWEGGPVVGPPGGSTLVAQNIADPDDWYLVVSARRDDALVVETVFFDGGNLELRAWPNDSDWSGFVAETIRKGLPALIAAVGRGWARDDIEILESYAPTIYGYAGWYLPDTGRIEMGEDLNTQVILHEAAHTWFNSELFDARWINEGFAEEFAYQARMAAGLNGFEGPTPPGDKPGGLVLNRWEIPRFVRGDVDDAELYGYRASWYVTHRLVVEIGVEKMAAVISAASEDRIAYRGSGTIETVGGADDWRRYLDLLEEVGGSRLADSLFRDFVVTRLEKETLDSRAAARAGYSALEVSAGEWALPPAVRTPMSEWNFDEAERQIAQAGGLIGTRDEITRTADHLGIKMPDLERAFEQAEDLTRIAADLAGQEAAVGELAKAAVALDDEQTILERMGLVGERPGDAYEQAVSALEANDLDQAIRSSQEVIAIMSGAGRRGVDRTLIGTGLAGLFGSVTFLVRRRQGASITQTFSSPST